MDQDRRGGAAEFPKPRAGRIRTGRTPVALKRAILDHLRYTQARPQRIATRNDWYMALAHAVRDRLLENWIGTTEAIAKRKEFRVVCYLSAEFLPGPHLGNALVCLGLADEAGAALGELGQALPEILAREEEPGLGNGGLGRLAACFMDSLATLEVPAIGYGIRYEFGIFDQEIRDGWQAEVTDKWLRFGNPWEIPRSDVCFEVKLGGRTEPFVDGEGRYRVRWIPDRVVRGVAYDTPVPGYRVPVTNLLRLWKAEACESFDFSAFNVGDYFGAVHEKVASETISKVLYPNDEPYAGKQLRLAQQFFFVSCSLQDMLRMHRMLGGEPGTFPDRFAAQLNDTHPSIAVAELMRLLVDEHGMDWEPAWEITRRTFAYTNHTLLPEALEKWPLPLFGEVLPRHLEIVFEINRRFLDSVRAERPGDGELAARLSLIDEGGGKAVRMAHLACVGSHAINGVAALHSDLLRKTVLRDFFSIFPEKFRNVTNGVTPRRWMVLSNPGLSGLISSRIGEGWVRNLEGELPRLEAHVDDGGFGERWRRVKAENKRALAKILRDRTGVAADPDSLFDIQVKRIHEYKRQHLNVLHVITLYLRILSGAEADPVPRTVIFGGKAAPGYFLARLIVKLIHSVAEVVNRDPLVSRFLRVAFLPDFNVKNAQPVYPAADLSEQISTAGKEASGTGNMKFSLNGALTIGTLDGANVEIREAVGAENFFLFGLTAEEVAQRKAQGYDPRSHYESDPELREALDQVAGGRFSGGDRALFRPIVESLLGRDEYLLLADYRSYVDRQGEVERVYRDRNEWTRRSIRTVARMGYFSSDRSIREYCDAIWRVAPARLGLREPGRGGNRSSG